jgi:hypothetical protein
VFERLVDIICERMTDSIDSDSSLANASKSKRLDPAASLNCANCALA